MKLHIRNRYLLGCDAVTLTACVAAAYTLRFEQWPLPSHRLHTAIYFTAIVVPLKLALFTAAGLYRRLWSYASIAELERIVISIALATVSAFLIGGFVLPASGLTPQRISLAVLALDSLLTAAAIVFPRLLYRILAWHDQRRRSEDGLRAIIVGAGSAGQMIAKELITNPRLGIYPVAFVDDDPRKTNHQLHEIPVAGRLDDLKHIATDMAAKVVVIAIPSAPGNTIRRIVKLASEVGLKTRILPSLRDVLSGQARPVTLRDVQIEDLLRREPVTTDLAAVQTLARGRTVLVTGAGGSIGSELCRQIAQLAPTKLVLLGHGENSIFDVHGELQRKHLGLPIVPIIADIRDRQRLLGIFQELRPYAVFHAAAHKHVPLMEENVVEALTNNVQGTKNVVDAAAAAEVQHLVYISTDKAVRPTSIMGATKRLAERMVQQAAITHRRNFVAVRFGNVLGSRGSVIPTFLNQIQAGGPVTVTHPEMRRYFMTIPEAVQLVLQAGALGAGGEVFVLDMGEPVRIVDLATDLISLCGMEAGRDIDIQFTGVRPGEKLYEEMFFNEENVVPTTHEKVLRARQTEMPDGLIKLVDRLIAAAPELPDEELREMIVTLVPDFQRPHAPQPVEAGWGGHGAGVRVAANVQTLTSA